MGLPRSTFYDAPAAKADDAEIVARIAAICDEFEAYGYRRVGAASDPPAERAGAQGGDPLLTSHCPASACRRRGRRRRWSEQALSLPKESYRPPFGTKAKCGSLCSVQLGRGGFGGSFAAAAILEQLGWQRYTNISKLILP
ncbi:MAG TPA: hypothetical protein VHG35_05565, partial [Gemmatimonadales bacterium]|nr:hypothetical protein [Gemmatimonadales bacterium]